MEQLELENTLDPDLRVSAPAGTVRRHCIVRSGGRFVASKNFGTRKDAKTWVTRIQADPDAMVALGSPEGVKTFEDGR